MNKMRFYDGEDPFICKLCYEQYTVNSSNIDSIIKECKYCERTICVQCFNKEKCYNDHEIFYCVKCINHYNGKPTDKDRIIKHCRYCKDEICIKCFENNSCDCFCRKCWEFNKDCVCPNS